MCKILARGCLNARSRFDVHAHSLSRPWAVPPRGSAARARARRLARWRGACARGACAHARTRSVFSVCVCACVYRGRGACVRALLACGQGGVCARGRARVRAPTHRTHARAHAAARRATARAKFESGRAGPRASLRAWDGGRARARAHACCICVRCVCARACVCSWRVCGLGGWQADVRGAGRVREHVVPAVGGSRAPLRRCGARAGRAADAARCGRAGDRRSRARLRADQARHAAHGHHRGGARTSAPQCRRVVRLPAARAAGLPAPRGAQAARRAQRLGGAGTPRVS